MLTAEKGKEFVDKAKALKASGYITKPLDMEKLSAVVNCLLTWNDQKNRPFTILGDLDA
jgi:AmiR/NasT family two-component response regulator